MLRPVALLLAALTLAPAADAQDGPRPRARGALQTARDCYGRRDYAGAQLMLSQAQMREDEMTPSERNDLLELARQNSLAIQEQRDGVSRLSQAEEAHAKGRNSEAAALVRLLSTNQYLAPGDKQRLDQLGDKLRAAGAATGLPQQPAGGTAKEDYKTLLAAARAALERGDFDKAEQITAQAEKVSPTIPTWMQPWNDNHTKVRRDVAAARAKLAEANKPAAPAEKSASPSPSPLLAPFAAVKNLFTRAPKDKEKDKDQPDAKPKAPEDMPLTAPVPQNHVATAAPAKPAPQRPGAAGSEELELARQLVKKGYEALERGDAKTAQQCADQAKALKVTYQFWDDTPDKLQGDIRFRSGQKSQVAQSPSVVPTQNKPPVQQVAARDTKPMPPPPPIAGGARPSGDQVDPRALLREGRAHLKQGRLDEADKSSVHAAAVPSVRWGLFEDTPDKLRVDVQKARAGKDREQSAQVLADARRLFEKGELDEAKKKAFTAQKLHGSYSVWDTGDRADRLLSEIAAAERKRGPATPNAVAQNTKPPAPPAVEKKPQPPAIQFVQAKQRALGLVAEARELQRKGQLVEARARVVEARRWAAEAGKGGVQFERHEENPDAALLGLNAQCESRVAELLRQSEDAVAASARDPKAMQRAGECIAQARQLANTFERDLARIDQKAAWLNQVQQLAAAPKQTPNLPTPPGVGSGKVGEQPITQVGGQQVAKDDPKEAARREGLEKLNKARLEISAGQLNNARRIAEAVFTGPHGLQDQARRVLNDIDAEEHNQRWMACQRRFDEASEAFRRRDYAMARTIIVGVDESLLSPDRMARLREISMAPDMQPGRAVAQQGGLQPVGGQQDGSVGRAAVTDQKPAVGTPGQVAQAAPESDFDRIRAIEKIQLDKLRVEALNERNRAQSASKAGDHDGALEILRGYVQRLEGAQLPGEQIALLRRPVERQMDELRTLKAQKTWEDRAGNRIVDNGTKREGDRILASQKRAKEVTELIDQYNILVRQSKFEEALVYAQKARELDPDNVAAQAAIIMGRIRASKDKSEGIKARNERFVFDSLSDADDLGPAAVRVQDPIRFDRTRTEHNRDHRKGYEKGIWPTQRNERERQIEVRLNMPVTLNVKDMPLKDVLDYLRNVSGGVNVIADTAALVQAGISEDFPLTRRLENISLKSALNILLKQAGLTYVIKDESIQVTTEEHAKGKSKVVTYPVADLVVPIENHSLPVVADFVKWAGDHHKPNMPLQQGYGATPYTGPGTLPPGSPVSSQNSGLPPGSLNVQGQQGHGAPPRAPNATIEDVLIRLITSTIDPHSWVDVGGKGTIQYFPIGLALVVNQVQDIQEQVQDLLQALRRLQDLEVAIEMRLVAVSESFFERLGMDFDINILNNNSRFEPQLLSNQFRPPGFINQFRPDTFFSGLTPAGTFTPDLGVPLRNSSFDFSLPPFGGYPGTLGADGGLSLGLAFLSDIQVFMLIQAAQGDRRVNVMQAPKITVFNGQTANIFVSDVLFFLTQINVVPFGSQLVFQPQNTPVASNGITLLVTPVVSADRRFVRLAMNPNLINQFSASVPLVPVQVSVNQLFYDGITPPGSQPAIFQTFFQQPAQQVISLQTTVVIPDGGTVLLGGLKALAEARNEFGPPILSKIPYINRLFKNVGYGRETSNLMILVTARIIINEEEEQIYLGNLQPIPR